MILDTLEKYHVIATFFDLGNLVETYPDVVQREKAIDCDVGSHTYSHKNLDNLSEEGVKQEIDKANNAFKKVLGQDAPMVRPPYGNANSKVRSIMNYPIVDWSVDSLD